MAAKTPLSDAVKARIVQLHGEGLSATGIAKELGVAVSSVSRFAKTAGLSFDTAQTAAATKANRDRAALVRSRLELSLLDDAAAVQMLLRSELTASNPRGVKDSAAAVSALVNGSLKIAGAAGDTNDAARGLMHTLMDELRNDPDVIGDKGD